MSNLEYNSLTNNVRIQHNKEVMGHFKRLREASLSRSADPVKLWGFPVWFNNVVLMVCRRHRPRATNNPTSCQRSRYYVGTTLLSRVWTPYQSIVYLVHIRGLPSKHEALKNNCLMMGQHRRQWATIKPTLVQRLVLVGAPPTQ